MLNKKIIQPNEVKTGMKVLTNGSRACLSARWAFGEVKCIHPDHFCIEYNNHNWQENEDLEKIWNDKTKCDGGGGCNKNWFCNTTISGLKIYEVSVNKMTIYGIDVEFVDMNTKTAVHCPTPELWVKVAKKSGKQWCSGMKLEDASCWDYYKENSCLNVGGQYLYYDSKQWFQNNNHTIISAEEYLGEGSVSSPSEPQTELKKTTMLNVLTNKIKRFLNKDLQILFKAQYLTNCGELTEEGWQELKSILAEKYQKELTESAQTKIDEEEKKK